MFSLFSFTSFVLSGRPQD